MTLQILFLKKNDFVGNLVKKVSNGIYSHCAFLIDGIMIADTDFTRDFGFRFLPWNLEEFDTVELNIKDAQKQEIIEWIQLHNGYKYDNNENWSFVLKKYFKTKENPHKLNCVESVLECLCDSGFLNVVYKTELFSPSELYEILKSKE